MDQHYREFLAAYKTQKDKINLILTLDHGGRGGSNYFQCLFDHHQQLIMCPLVHYVYSYWQSCFGKTDKVKAKKAHEFISQISYFRLLYNDPENEHGALITKIGGNIKDDFDREKYRFFVDQFFNQKNHYTRRETIMAAMLIYTTCRGFEIENIKYIGLNDSVSTRTENPYSDYKIQIIDIAKQDFPSLKIITLWRDPRAQFASTRQQLLNAIGSDGDTKSLKALMLNAENFDTGPAFLFSALYQSAAYKSLIKKIADLKTTIFYVKNEDFNLNFVPTMQGICNELDIKPDPEWFEKGDNYKAYMMGRPWGGTGAYNPRYETGMNLVLPTEDHDKVHKTLGPNKHVTERWKSKLKENEKQILEILFADEIKNADYKFLYPAITQKFFLVCKIWIPWQHEFSNIGKPHHWISNIRSGVIYLISRLKLLYLYYVARFFTTKKQHNISFTN